ncbi:NAD(P)-binding protein [Mytilinidion resinicola]|uniref:NAD(P)-binding protein n=1 Tax=Mytilinidion resinicola TaxID=574789 RepID=A0A6A6Z2G3_9PEZI|nr:NAD(P)-binding protein [Mytilinidion resinicola]KAF2814998.1 NAD(P)-binding protein [Mytilinidion resinicola]
MSSLKDKVIVVSGGASGIGLVTAKLLASRGARVSIGDVQEGPLDEAAKEIRSAGGEVMTFKMDVRDRKQVDAWIDATVSKFGKLNGAANLAGVTGNAIGIKTAADIEDSDWDFVIGVNLTGLMYCQRAQLQNMENGGSIVNAASVAGISGRAKNASYSASKHGVVGLTRSAAKDMGSRGIRVNAIAPGTIETPMVAKAREIAGAGNPNVTFNNYAHTALNRPGKPSEVATLVAFLLGDESTFITGAIHSVDGGWIC